MQLSPLKIAIIDMYDGTKNIGMSCIESILNQWSDQRNIEIDYQVFRLREHNEIPDSSFDIYLSSGGPGSPNDSYEMSWDKLYTEWLDSMLETNKPAFLICHSFQIACRHFEIGNVCARKSRQIGILPIHPLVEDDLFKNLQDPFFALESRYYQIIEPNDEKILSMGAKIIALEKIRPQVPLERAIMAIQFSDNMYGVQFHPEAETNSLYCFFNDPVLKKTIIDEFGTEKWNQIIEKLHDSSAIDATFSNLIPNFLDKAIKE